MKFFIPCWKFFTPGNISWVVLRNSFQKQLFGGVLKKGVLKNVAKFTEKHLCQGLFFNNVVGLRLGQNSPWDWGHIGINISEYKAKEGSHGTWMQKWNIGTNGAQRVDERNWIICLVITFTPRVLVIKMSKMAHFLYFLLMKAAN